LRVECPVSSFPHIYSRLKASVPFGILTAAWYLKGIMVEAAGTNGDSGQGLLQATGGVRTLFKLQARDAELPNHHAEVSAPFRRALGELPPRPDPSMVEVVSSADSREWLEERIEIDNNGAVPGVFLLSASANRKVTAILHCYWHGVEYAGSPHPVTVPSCTS